MMKWNEKALVTAALACLLSAQSSNVVSGFQVVDHMSVRTFGGPLVVSTALKAATSDLPKNKESETNKTPYAVARGDGSTGGGGVSMPKRKTSDDQERSEVDTVDEDGLRRPKVGAEMPKGRPSWFKVPGPSQGTL